jgi:hypothetical protein
VRCLFVLSADYGEFVTASLLSRGQPFERHFALPAALAPQAVGLEHAAPYASIGELRAIVEREPADVAVLGSGYLFAVNALFGPDALAELVAALRGQGIALATTDPWLRLPHPRLTIHSMRLGGVDAAQTENVRALQRRLEEILRDVPHLLAVPAPDAHACYNPAFAQPPRPRGDEWLFVLSQQDLNYLSNDAFFAALHSRVTELLRNPGNRLRFIGPRQLGRFLAERFASESRLEYLGLVGFAAFEEALLRARVVAYWNALSASALYCLYHGVAPVFFGRGHQARVCEGLYEHAVEHVYRGEAPAMLQLDAPFETDAGALIEARGLHGWLDRIRRDYARLPQPAEVLGQLCSR